VLTNDLWNVVMNDVGVVPVGRAPDRVLRMAPVVCEDPPLAAIAGHPIAIERDRVGDEIATARPEGLAAVEDGLCHVLWLTELLGPHPRAPVARTPAGCPRWSEIYYLHDIVVAGQRKRYVVVSDNAWNEVDGTAVVVRTTSSARRHGPEFPLIENGQAKAVCAELTTYTWDDFILDPRRRPPIRYLDLKDMQAIAGGLVQTHGLDGAVRRALGSLARPRPPVQP